MESKKASPYVISADANGLLEKWYHSSHIVSLGPKFFEERRQSLTSSIERSTGSPVEIVSEDLLKSGLIDLSARSRHPIISIDRAYVDPRFPNLRGFIDITRMVDPSFNDIGLRPRHGALPIEDQINRLRTHDIEPITLIDDVLFSGKNLPFLLEKLREANRPVKKLIAGIGIEDGIRTVEGYGLEVECLLKYESVVDEVCERDFYACIPMSGRSMDDGSGTIWSVPYFAPFGDAGKWASIPDGHTDEFSRICLENSIALWREIENNSQISIHTDTVPRRVRDLKQNYSVVNALEYFLHQRE